MGNQLGAKVEEFKTNIDETKVQSIVQKTGINDKPEAELKQIQDEKKQLRKKQRKEHEAWKIAFNQKTSGGRYWRELKL
jgi:hypothetical protein